MSEFNFAEADYGKIYNHFGRETQIEKLREEVEEFIQAIQNNDIPHASEEFADILNVMAGFFTIDESLDDDLAETTLGFKYYRTIARIGSGYYDKEKADAKTIHQMDR